MHLLCTLFLPHAAPICNGLTKPPACAVRLFDEHIRGGVRQAQSRAPGASLSSVQQRELPNSCTHTMTHAGAYTHACTRTCPAASRPAFFLARVRHARFNRAVLILKPAMCDLMGRGSWKVGVSYDHAMFVEELSDAKVSAPKHTHIPNRDSRSPRCIHWRICRPRTSPSRVLDLNIVSARLTFDCVGQLDAILEVNMRSMVKLTR